MSMPKWGTPKSWTGAAARHVMLPGYLWASATQTANKKYQANGHNTKKNKLMYQFSAWEWPRYVNIEWYTTTTTIITNKKLQNFFVNQTQVNDGWIIVKMELTVEIQNK